MPSAYPSGHPKCRIKMLPDVGMVKVYPKGVLTVANIDRVVTLTRMSTSWLPTKDLGSVWNTRDATWQSRAVVCSIHCFLVQCFRKNRPVHRIAQFDSPIEGPSSRLILRTRYQIPTGNRGCPLWASIRNWPNWGLTTLNASKNMVLTKNTKRLREYGTQARLRLTLSSIIYKKIALSVCKKCHHHYPCSSSPLQAL